MKREDNIKENIDFILKYEVEDKEDKKKIDEFKNLSIGELWNQLNQKFEIKEDHKKELTNILNNIENLDEKFNGILDKHHNDYLVSFNEFMDRVKRDIKSKIEEMERVEKERRKNENIKIIMAEREFFRSEAIRLNKLCKDLNSKLEQSTKQINDKDNDIKKLKAKGY